MIGGQSAISGKGENENEIDRENRTLKGIIHAAVNHGFGERSEIRTAKWLTFGVCKKYYFVSVTNNYVNV